MRKNLLLEKAVRLLLSTFAFLILLLSVNGYGQISESFESGLPLSYDTTPTTRTLSSGSWQMLQVIAGTTGVNTGTKSAQLQSQTGSQLTTPTLTGGVGTISFYVTASTTSGGYQVKISTDNGTTWSQVTGSPFTIGTTKTLKTITVNNPNVNKIQIYRTGATIYIDDFSTTLAPGLTAPTLTTAANATVDAPFDVTFTDDATWRGAITGVTVGGTALTAGYSVSSGKITFTPSASVPANLLQSSGTKSIVVNATGYSGATVSQTIGVGAPAKLAMNTQPAAPSTNGGALATQPKVNIVDQYGNVVTTSTASITAAVGAGTWSIGGTPTVSASAGVATFTNLTATSAAAVTGATITFSSSGLTGVTSATFNIPGSPPTLTAAANATVVAPFDVTFTDDATWRAAISSITVGGTTLAASAYTVSTGKITFTPSASTLLQSAGSKSIIVSATGYYNATVTQTIGAGAASKLSMNTQPIGPTANGDVLATQPKVNVTDQYGNVVTTSTATVTATVGAGAWVLGGTTAVNATSGAVTYSGLTASSLAAVTGATITFSSTGLTGVTSGPFNIIAPTTTAPVATAATNVNATSFTANWNAMPGATSYVIDVYTKALQSNQTVAAWTFPNTTDDNSIDEYNINNSGKAITGQGFSTTNPPTVTYTQLSNPLSTTSVVSSTGWDAGNGSKFWQIDINTTGASQMKLSSVQRSSNTGPRDFKVQYQVGAGAWTDVTGTTLTVGNNWTSGVLTDVALPSACDNQSSVLIRWIMTSNTSVNGGANVVASGGTSAIDNIYIKGDFLANSYLVQNSNVGNVTSFTVTGLNPVSTYYYVVRAVNGAVVSPNSNEIQVTTRSGATTWNGTAWSDGAPLKDIDAILDGDYSGASFESKTITVNTGKTLTVNSFVKTGNVTNNGNIIVANNANFLQIGSFTSGDGASFKVRKDTKAVKRLAYMNWSSPMANSSQTLKQFSYGKNANGTAQSSTGTLDNRFYTYNNNAYVLTAPSGTFTKGQGYLIRTPNDFTTTPQIFHAQFEGTIPNAGNITYDHSSLQGNFILLGNPYPSAISYDDFMIQNTNTTGTVYVWNSQVEMVNNQYAGTIYNTFTSAGANPANSLDAYIPVGQGFFVQRTNNNPFVFTDAMRRTTEVGVTSKSSTVSKNRFWLELASPSGAKPQMLLGFFPGTNKGIDKGYDAILLDATTETLYSTVEDKKLIIDAHGGFDEADEFSLSANLTTGGNYTISLLQKEGIFSNGQKIYLKDNLTGAVTDLTTDKYEFTETTGLKSNRFTLQFKPSGVLGSQDLAKEELNIISVGKEVRIKAGQNVATVEIYDLTGKKLIKVQPHQRETVINLSTEGMIVVKVTLQNGREKSKKLIIK